MPASCIRELILIPGDELTECPDTAPQGSGVCLIFLEGGRRLLEETGYFEMADDVPLTTGGKVHLYTGAANNLRQAMRRLFAGTSRSSDLRKTLLSIECAKNAIRRSLTPECGVTGEKTLSRWLFRNALVAMAETPEPFQQQTALLRQFVSPFNIAERKAHPYSHLLANWRADAFRKAKRLNIPKQATRADGKRAEHRHCH